MEAPALPPGQLVETEADDQRFLLNFITGYYLGPDVQTDIPRRAILQRFEQGMPPYESTDLGSSVLTLPELECLYSFIWKDTHPSAVLKEPSLHQYFNNKLPPPRFGSLGDTRQFHAFFPLERHPQERHGRNSKTFKGIIIINDPDTSHIKPTALERFKLLTGRNEARINLEDFEVYCAARKDEKNKKKMKRREDSAKKRAQQMEPLFVQPLRMLPLDEPLAICYQGNGINSAEAGNGDSQHFSEEANNGDSQHFSEPSFVYAGTAEGERSGPPVGQFDIGVSDEAYFCRVSLPGVQLDGGKLDCVVSPSGQVTIKGFTMTGEDCVYEGGQIFEMLTKRLAPFGEFSISFNLPGPVENRATHVCNIKDGLFELIVGKRLPLGKRSRTSSR
ncbi:hypothetical protein AQUCO_01500269v1 [Aquilegia coerulea]|uniref:SHSP domain-containing protein n=1 Tax=Aquilegia coerulea TaxID=218851 RepID=A0A2G5DSX2_AQUCA|nr:hypothetical protein AQUCO_01500269v1 [Aquilegia coerulea]